MKATGLRLVSLSFASCLPLQTFHHFNSATTAISCLVHMREEENELASKLARLAFFIRACNEARVHEESRRLV